MSKNQQSQTSPQYRSAKIVRYGSETYIVFYISDADGKLIRQKKRCNSIIASCENANEAKQKLQTMCNEINIQLASIYDHHDNESSAPDDLIKAMDLFLQNKERELRKDTIRSYSYFCRKFSQWLSDNHLTIQPCQLDKLTAIRFLDNAYLTLCPRSYNNLLKYGRTFYAWLIERGYANHNVFADIKTKKTYGKRRKVIAKIDRERITAYLANTDTEYLIYLRLIFVSLIRPKEIRMLRVGDVYPTECRIVIRPEIAKTHIERNSYCSPDLMSDLVRVLHIDSRHPDELLFGGRSRHYYLLRWHKLRQELNLPADYQMYSFRDTGITEYLKIGLDTLTVMQLAGHTDLSTTSIYARHADNSLYVKLGNRDVEI